jgi:hypothetical protein
MDDKIKYSEILTSIDSTSEEIAPIAMAIHELLGLPIAMRSLNKKGVRIEKGKILDTEYTGPVLEQVLKENRTLRTVSPSGQYAGIPVVAAPIRDKEGSAIATIGVLDVVGTVDLGRFVGNNPESVKQLQEAIKKRVGLALF